MPPKSGHLSHTKELSEFQHQRVPRQRLGRSIVTAEHFQVNTSAECCLKEKESHF